MNLDYKALGKRIKLARIQEELTQERLSEIVGISPSHMNNVENGSAKVSLPTLLNIANTLNVSMDELLCDNIVNTRPQFEHEIKRLLDSCDEYEIRIVTDIISALLETLRRDSVLKDGVAYYRARKKS